jgi:hypothetical protein
MQFSPSLPFPSLPIPSIYLAACVKFASLHHVLCVYNKTHKTHSEISFSADILVFFLLLRHTLGSLLGLSCEQTISTLTIATKKGH